MRTATTTLMMLTTIRNTGGIKPTRNVECSDAAAVGEENMDKLMGVQR